MNIFECAVIKNMIGGGGGTSGEVLSKIADLEARVDALEPGNLFNISAFHNTYEVEDGTLGVLAMSEWGEHCDVRELCPDLIEGKTYTFSCDVKYVWGYGDVTPYVSVGSFDGYMDTNEWPYRVCFTFTYHSGDEIAFHGSYMTDYQYDGEGNMMPTMVDVPVVYYHIMVNEGTEPLPWKPYKG